MKLFADWGAKYIGFKLKSGMVYYVAISHPEARLWGYENIWHDGPLKRFGLWYIQFNWHYD
jgi:hypothetical protein